MISRLHLTPIVFFIGLVWLGLLFINGVAVEISWLKHLSVVVPVLLVAIGVFDRWLWRLPWLNGWFANRPVLCGTWRVDLRSEWVNPATGAKPAPIICYMAVRQTFSSLSMRLMTAESASELVAERILVAGDGVSKVVGVYVNEPKLSVRDGSAIHYGALLLEVHGDPPSTLEGSYWTDRESRGTMRLADRRAKVFPSFEEANKAFQASSSN
jgi:hypothetical protein